MKFTTRLFLYWVSIFLVFFIGVIVVAGLLWSVQIHLWQAALVFLIVGVIPPAIITGFFYKRLDYMENEDIEPPSFPGQKKATFKFKARSRHHFDEIMQRIDRQWIISFSEREKHVLKFRTDSRMLSWGIGGYVKMEDENTAFIVVYPMFPNSRREQQVMNQTLRIMQLVLNP